MELFLSKFKEIMQLINHSENFIINDEFLKE